MTRIVITGGPRTGKTTLAKELAYAPEFLQGVGIGVIRHTDSLIGTHDWSAASAEVAKWIDEPGPWIIDGVAASRALRKWHEAHPGEAPPVDRVIYLAETFEDVTAAQEAMAKGVETVHREIEWWLADHGVRTEFLTLRELRCDHPGWNGKAML